MNAMLRLSSKSGIYPKTLVQNSVTIKGSNSLAAGQFGVVWKGTFQGQQVAVKFLGPYATSNASQHVKVSFSIFLQRFVPKLIFFQKIFQETLIWRQLRHINVLPFLCLHHPEKDSSRLGLVSPWMQNGNLQEFLRRVSGEDRLRPSLVSLTCLLS